MKPQQVIMIRHGEKANEQVHLSQQGQTRASELPNFFIHHRPNGLMLPTALIVMKQKSSDNSNRPYETIQPLAQALNLQISDDFTQEQIDEVVHQIKHTDTHALLVCWEHEALVKIAKGLDIDVKHWGIDPMNGKKDESDCFDAIWVLDDNHFKVFRQFDVNEACDISYSNVPDTCLFSCKV